MASHIISVTASQRLDASGNPVLETKVFTSQGSCTSVISSGATGKYGGTQSSCDSQEYLKQALNNIENVITPSLIAKGFDLSRGLDQVDEFLTELMTSKMENGSCELGKQETMGVSIACSRAGAACAGLPLYEFLRQKAAPSKTSYVMPVPFFTVLNSDGLEYSIAPVGAMDISNAIQAGSEVYRYLRDALGVNMGAAVTHTGSSGSFTLPLLPHLEALHLLATAIHAAGQTGKISIGINAASATLNTPEKLSIYREIMSKYPIALLEDPFLEDEWGTWTQFMVEKSKDGAAWEDVEIVACETMGPKRMEKARARGVCNGIRLSLDQFSTLTEFFAAANQAISYGWGVFISYSPLETNDSFIADLAVALRCGHIKSGAPARGENVVKYNRLLEIYEEIKGSGGDVGFAGLRFRGVNRRAG